MKVVSFRQRVGKGSQVIKVILEQVSHYSSDPEATARNTYGCFELDLAMLSGTAIDLQVGVDDVDNLYAFADAFEDTDLRHEVHEWRELQIANLAADAAAKADASIE